MTYISLFDTTLRDGLQNADISCSPLIRQAYLDEVQKYNFDYTETAMIDSNDPTLSNIVNPILLALPRRKNIKKAVLSGVSLHFVIKADPLQIRNVIGRDPNEYVMDCVAIIKESIASGVHTLCVLEHFFDAFLTDPDFVQGLVTQLAATEVVNISLADTNGGTLPHQVEAVLDRLSIPMTRLGVHMHDDMGLAIANSLAAVRKGVRLLQGTWNGMGERCGNMNLVTAFCTLMLKMGYRSCLSEWLSELTASSAIINKLFRVNGNNLPYIGTNAFSHKGGIHINGVSRSSSFYEHIDPTLVGNQTKIVVSEMMGTSSLVDILGERPPTAFLPIARTIVGVDNWRALLQERYREWTKQLYVGSLT